MAQFFILIQTVYSWLTMERKFSAIITKEGGFFIARCPEIDVTSQGKSESGALKNLEEAVGLFLEDDPVGLPEKRKLVEFKIKMVAHA